MAFFNWVAQEQKLTNAALTVLVQTIDPNNLDELTWPVFFPRQTVNSVKMSTITPVIPTRFVSDRREWNARGRYIPQEFPGTAELEMVPIESFFNMGEREVQHLLEQLRGNQDMFRREVMVTVPDRTRQLALANWRRVEVDTMNSWATGQVTARNPVTGTTYTASYNFAASRYQVAGVPWTGGPGGTAYNNLLAWLRQGIDMGMTFQGIMTRSTTRNAVISSAPNTRYPLSPDGRFTPLIGDVEARIQDELQIAFNFYLNERSVDIFPDGGITTVATKLWPGQTIAAIPAGETVGYTALAPVARAYDVSAVAPEAEIDINGMTVYQEVGGNGRWLNVECQVNALPVPLERNVWVMNTGV